MIALPQISGCKRKLDDLLGGVVGLYYECVPEKIRWYEKPGVFYLAYGADGAPMSKYSEAVSFLVSVMNMPEYVQSCDHNFLLLAGKTKEDSSDLLNELTILSGEMKNVQNSTYKLPDCTHPIKFKFTEFLSDMKFISVSSGQLNNAARFPSPFGNVSKTQIGNTKYLHKEFGPGQFWEPWDSSKIQETVNAVNKFKQSIKPGLKQTTVRNKVLDYMAEVLQTRQEEMPYLGMFAENRRPDPLHIKNICWESWHKDILTNAIKNSKDILANAAKNGQTCKPDFDNLESLPECLLKKHLITLKTIKANGLLRKIIKWQNESEGKGSFEYRFNGETSRKVGSNYHLVVENVKNPQYRALLSHAGLLLRDLSAELAKIHVAPDYPERIKEKCRSFYTMRCLTGHAVLSDWTLAYPVPYHAKQIYDKYGFGYGIVSMQGREAKHRRIKSYIKNTKRDITTWPKVFEHEYIQTIYLPAESESQDHFVIKPQRASERFVPVIGRDQCYCGVQLVNNICPSCTSPFMVEAKLSCTARKLTKSAKANFSV